MKSRIYIIVLIPACILLLRFCLLQFYIVSGNSMLPALQHGNFILVVKNPARSCPLRLFLQQEIRRNDFVVFQTPDGDTAVKRAVGLPGERYSFAGKHISINNTPLQEEYIINAPPNLDDFSHFAQDPYLAVEKQGRIPPDYFLLLGDNRRNSSDSRHFGLVPSSRIIGRVLDFQNDPIINK